MNTTSYTALILGGGPAGSAAATALARAGIDTLLVDAGTDAPFRVGESLVPSAKGILRELGLWDAFVADGHMPCYGNYSAWGSSAIAETDFIRSPYGHGWHLDRVRFDATLRRGAADAGAKLMRDTRLLRFERAREGWSVMMRGEGEMRKLACTWLLDCTGRSRRIAAGLGIERRFADRQIAFHARFRQEEGSAPDRESRTLVESAPQGWLHTALLPGAERVVTLFTDPDTSLRTSARARDGFLDAVAESVHVARLLRERGYAIVEDPRAADASSSSLDRFHGDGWLAAGDAATSFDPLSSQGILSALYSGMKAGTALAAHLAGDADALMRYDAQIGSVYDRFLEERRGYYRMERRWPGSSFWRARMEDVGRSGTLFPSLLDSVTMEDAAMSNQIKVKNPVEEREKGNPTFDDKPELGDEARADEVTSANEELQIAHGDDPDGTVEVRDDDISGPLHSVDEHMSAGSESAEDKANDIINSGILRI